jgi:hypothetical protein
MPWSVVSGAAGCEPSKPFGVRNDDTGEVVGCHETRGEAEDHAAALYANVGDASMIAQFAASMSGAMIAFLPADAAALAVEGGDPAGQLHITAVYLVNDASQLDQAEIDALNEVCAEIAQAGPPIVADVAAVATFRPGEDGTSATALLLESEDLVYAHDMLDDVAEPYVAEDVEQHPLWIPHLTLGYAQPPETGIDQLGQQIVIDRIGLFLGGDITEFPLTGGGPGEDIADAPPEEPAAEPTEAEPVPTAAATIPSFRLIPGEGGPASDTPAMAITRHPAAGFYAGPAPLHAVKEN